MKITIIVPVYNVEKYLHRCVESLTNQTLKDIEIILVDDGSPDNCPTICDELATTDTRIKVIHKKNGGLSSARNAGLNIASGEYVAFIDSDDWVEKDTFEYCYNLVSKHKAEAVQFGIYITNNQEKAKQPKEDIKILNGKDILEYYLDSSTRKSGGYSVCRCLFKTSIAKSYKFREGKINEDIDYKYKVLRDCNAWIITNQNKYYYWQEGESLSMGGLRKKDFDLRDSANILAELTSTETYGKIAFLGKVKQSRTAFSLLSKIAYFGVSDSTINEPEIISELTKEHRKNLMTLLKAPLPLSRKILSIMFAINFGITKALINLAKKM